jgi:pyruvate formate lyase activating enzyme
MTGVVFDIQRFALHDGPGIRTAVFLKGCPLQCLWCHNPESQVHEPQLSYNAERCTSCPACEEAHLHGVRHLQAGPQALDLADENVCIAACPHGAFSIVGRTMTVEGVMDEVMRDEPYYRRSGGGVTLSGGEPLAQYSFTLTLLREAKERGLHTCVDTSGVVSKQKIAAVAKYTDLFLYDYKASDPARHLQLTGATNGRVLANLDFLYELGARIRLRCPLVPGVNDCPSHLEGIARLSHRYPNLEGVEIMAYHDMGRDKAERIGRAYMLSHVPSADEHHKAFWLDELHRRGCTRARIG